MTTSKRALPYSERAGGSNARLLKPAWLIEQIQALAKDAEENSKEDIANAELTSDPVLEARYQGAAEADAHWARQLRRILTGKTWDEAFAESVRRADSKAPR